MKCNRTYRDSYKKPDRDWDRRPDCGDHHDDYYPPMPPLAWPKPKPRFETATILKCGTSTGSAPLSTDLLSLRQVEANNIAVNGGHGNSAVLSTLTLDTSELIDAVVKFDFSSLITYRINDIANYSLRLLFKLRRVCDGDTITLGTWTFERSQVFPNPPTIPEEAFQNVTEPFSFSWCSCAGCPDCCTYTVEVEQQAFNIDFVTITNLSTSALAVGFKMVDKD